MWNISTTLNSENIKKNFRILRNLLIKSNFFIYCGGRITPDYLNAGIKLYNEAECHVLKIYPCIHINAVLYYSDKIK